MIKGSLVISYNKLWKLMIDKRINRRELCRITEISPSTMTKLSSNEAVNLKTLIRICEVLECDVGDMMELIPADRYEQDGRIET